MAIVIEEGRKSFGFLNFLIWILVLGIVFFATYYIFFKQPEAVGEFIPSKNVFENLKPLSKITLDPEITKSPAFTALTAYITIPTDGQSGRLNPFSPF